MYIPNSAIFKNVLDHYNFHLNDMENFSHIRRETNLIKNLPIFISNNEEDNDEIRFVTENYEIFQIIFDAAAIGQYLGGVDPKNCSGDTTGFINETCIIKYNEYQFIWEEIENIKKPFIIINNIKVPIYNLHIHCKNLKKFM
jgi:hypothetical protein